MIVYALILLIIIVIAGYVIEFLRWIFGKLDDYLAKRIRQEEREEYYRYLKEKREREEGKI